MNWIIYEKNIEVARLTGAELKAEVKAGRITVDTMICREGSDDIMPAGKCAKRLFLKPTTPRATQNAASHVESISSDTSPAASRLPSLFCFLLALGAVCITLYAGLRSAEFQLVATSDQLINAEGGSIATDEAPLTNDEMAELYTEWIDDLAGHPDDRALPNGVIGASDSVLASSDPREIVDLIRETRQFAESSPHSPRLLFALGRAAMFHGYDQLSEEFLQKAANGGSGGAVAYQAYIAQERGDLQTAKTLLDKARVLGFLSVDSNQMLAELSKPSDVQTGTNVKGFGQTHQEKISRFDPAMFNRSDIIKALYEGDMATLNGIKTDSILYLTTLHNSIADQSILFHVENRKILLEIDPAVSTAFGRKILSAGDVQSEVATANIKSVLGMLTAVAETRQRGGSIMQEVTAANSSLANSAPMRYEELQQQASQDALKLAILFDENPEAFRRVYRGIREFSRS